MKCVFSFQGYSWLGAAVLCAGPISYTPRLVKGAIFPPERRNKYPVVGNMDPYPEGAVYNSHILWDCCTVKLTMGLKGVYGKCTLWTLRALWVRVLELGGDEPPGLKILNPTVCVCVLSFLHFITLPRHCNPAPRPARPT